MEAETGDGTTAASSDEGNRISTTASIGRSDAYAAKDASMSTTSMDAEAAKGASMSTTTDEVCDTSATTTATCETAPSSKAYEEFSQICQDHVDSSES